MKLKVSKFHVYNFRLYTLEETTNFAVSKLCLNGLGMDNKIYHRIYDMNSKKRFKCIEILQ